MFKTLRTMSKRVHADERGDIPVGTLLLIGLVVIPMVIGLIAFGEDITSWLSDRWGFAEDAAKDINYNPKN